MNGYKQREGIGLCLTGTTELSFYSTGETQNKTKDSVSTVK